MIRRTHYDLRCVYSSSQVIMRLSQSARVHFMILTVCACNYLQSWTYLVIYLLFLVGTPLSEIVDTSLSTSFPEMCASYLLTAFYTHKCRF